MGRFVYRIEDQRIAGRLIDPRLGAARKIDNREPCVAERDVGIDKDAAAVRAAMGERAVHRPQYIAHFGVGGGEAGYATHPSTIGSAPHSTTCSVRLCAAAIACAARQGLAFVRGHGTEMVG